MLVRVIKKQHVKRALRKIRVKFLQNVGLDFAACKRFINFWNGDVDHFPSVDPFWKLSFQEESLVKISRMSNNSDIFKIYYVVVLWTWLEILESWSNSPFVKSVNRVFSDRSVWP